ARSTASNEMNLTYGGKTWTVYGAVQSAIITDTGACCIVRVGNANGVGIYPQEVTISDIQTLVAAKFIYGTCAGVVSCLVEADVNQSGGANPKCSDITISDVQTLVNHLFIAGPTKAPLRGCL
ncbi:MAG: hypothetical protein NTW07_01495, partial [candidate division Zixibacteria bacterium]|nr:hypothetical protein [candidate division Zixibacteria bacterium]